MITVVLFVIALIVTLCLRAAWEGDDGNPVASTGIPQ